ncbi:MAG: hypothetical protein HY721_24460 [Planctomycetes bacterium]|nr:hypothetical protein [Planctomycetota bacterium]
MRPGSAGGPGGPSGLRRHARRGSASGPPGGTRRGAAAIAPSLLAIALALATLPGLSCAPVPRRAGAGAAPVELEEKSVLAGELLAIFPGLFVHGLGHRYAGNAEQADDLLMMELYSGLTAGLGGGLYAIGDSEDADAVRVAGWVGIGVGGAGFLGSWLYDIVFTPGEIERYNRKLREARP